MTTIKIAVTVLLVAGAVGAERWLAANRALADAAPNTTDVSRLSPEAARMYAAVKKPHPGELKWQQIPWLVDLADGMRLAKEENRPLLIFVSGDDPLEKC